MTSTEKTGALAHRYIVRGRVQGVGFRWFVEREAHILGIGGWVRNNSDGSVEVLAQGTREQLLGLRSRLRQGPRAARVDDVEEFKAKLGLATLIDALAEYYLPKKVDLILGMEARGFIFGPALAYRLNAGFVPVRKPGKLPAATAKYDYALEYGTNTLEIHRDAIEKGQRVLICDDLLATGGTAEATAKLAESLGGEIAGLGFVVELDFLNPRAKLTQYDVFSLLHYDK